MKTKTQVKYRLTKTQRSTVRTVYEEAECSLCEYRFSVKKMKKSFDILTILRDQCDTIQYFTCT